MTIDLKKLNQKGFSHHLVLMLVVLGVAVGGTFMLVASHADPWGRDSHTPGYERTNCNENDCAKNAMTGPKPNVCADHPRPGCVAKPQKPFKQTAPPSQQDKDGAGAAGASAPAPVGDEPEATVAATASFTSVPPTPRPKPEGNIVVKTFVKDEKGKEPIGLVKIAISREGGKELCDNRKSKKGTTNSSHPDNTKDGQAAYGVVHWLGCSTGIYTVTASRSGYDVLVGGKTTHVGTKHNVNVGQGDTAIVKFTIVKKEKKTKTTTKGKASTDINTAPRQ